MKLLRTIRLDPSDGFVFDRAALPGEWAVPGGFEFGDRDVAEMPGRERQAFRAGFLGLGTFGWSTLVTAVEATLEDRTTAVNSLAQHLMRAHGAPDLATATKAAAAEIAYAESLAQHPVNTLVALHRVMDAAGDIREQFRTLHAADAAEASRMPCSAGAFAIVEDDTADVMGPDEGLDLAALAVAASAPRNND